MLRTSFTLLAAVAVLGLSAPASADDQEASGNPLSVHGGLYLPVGNWADAAGIGIGANVRYSHALSDVLNVTGGLGLVFHLPKEYPLIGDVSVMEIPVMAGVTYELGSLFVFGELGLNLVRVSGDAGSDSETEVALFAGAGYDLGAIDVRGGIMASSISEFGDSMSIVVLAGYEFMRL